MNAAGPIPTSVPLGNGDDITDIKTTTSGPFKMSAADITVDDIEHVDDRTPVVNSTPVEQEKAVVSKIEKGGHENSGVVRERVRLRLQDDPEEFVKPKKVYTEAQLNEEFLWDDIPEVLPFSNGDGSDNRVVALNKPSSVMSEEYRSIRTSVLARWENKRHLVHTITSATPQEGKTITSLNLGFSLAELHNRKTIVIEADLRLPQFGKLLNLHPGPGVVSLLEGEAGFDEVLQEVGDNNLHVIPAGTRSSTNAVQLISSNRMARFVQFLKKRYDHVIIDTPPVIELADAGILGALSDDVYLIVRMNRTPRALVEQATRTLESYNAPVAGLIATDNPRHRRKYYYYRYGYRYSYRYYNKAAA